MSAPQSASLDGCDKPATAASPFDDPKADLIIRSSDNIHFYVHKSLLSIVSPVFESMFTLSDDASQELYDDRPCLPVSDDSRHLFCLLSWCDPRCKRPPPTLDNLVMTLEIADKYDMDSIFAHAQKDLLAHDAVESEPLTTFAIAIRFRLDEVARKAARETLRFTLAVLPRNSELEHISALALQNLHNYHFECKMVVRDLFASASWAEEMEVVAQLMSQHPEAAKGQPHTHGAEYFSLTKVSVYKNRVLWLPAGGTAPWWSIYMNAMMFASLEQPDTFNAKACVVHTSLLNRIRQSISLDECIQCRGCGYTRLGEVFQHLSKVIDKVVSKVPFEVEY